MHLSLFSVDLLKFCCSFCDLDIVHSNVKVIQYLKLTIAFKLVLSQSSQILLPLCNPAIPSLAVSCFSFQIGFAMVELMVLGVDTLYNLFSAIWRFKHEIHNKYDTLFIYCNTCNYN